MQPLPRKVIFFALMGLGFAFQLPLLVPLGEMGVAVLIGLIEVALLFPLTTLTDWGRKVLKSISVESENMTVALLLLSSLIGGLIMLAVSHLDEWLNKREHDRNPH